MIFSTSYRARSEIWAVEVETGTLRPLVKTPAAAYDPVVTPDGRILYFSALTSEVKDLWRLAISPDLTELGEPAPGRRAGRVERAHRRHLGRRQEAGLRRLLHPLEPVAARPRTTRAWRAGEAQPLTYGDDRYSRPSFSPDGKTLAFDFWKTGVPINVWLMDWKSGERRQALRSGAATSHASWLADGRLAFTSWDEKTQTRAYLRFDPAAGAESPLKELPRDADWAVLSPDGRKLAYHTRAQGTSLNIWLQDLESGGAARQVTFHENLAGFPVFSHDGKWLAYQVRQGDDTQLWQLELATGLARQLTFDPGASYPFSYLPDDSRIAFAGLREGLWNLYWIAPGNLEQKALTRSSSLTSYLRYPTFSPDGKTLVYEKAESSGDLFLVDGFLQ